jgi:beta-glucanase (GH16 family)
MDVSAKLPKTANGLWPAIWLLGTDQSRGWPSCGEIDILEMGGKAGIDNGTSERFVTSGTHWGELLDGGAHPAYARNDNVPVNLQDDFHLYTFTWDETKIRIFIDPELDSDANIVNPDNTWFYEILINVYNGEYPVGEYFHKPFFIILNLAVGGDFPSIYDIDKITALNEANNFEAKMYIDYIKIYDGVKAENIKWQDLFDGNTLDDTKWNIEVNDDGGGNNELQSYRSQNISVGKEPETDKNCLIITAKKQAE